MDRKLPGLSRVHAALTRPLLGQRSYGWCDFALLSVGARHALPNGPAFSCWRPPRTGGFLAALGRSLAAERGLGWAKNRPCERPIPLAHHSPETPSRQFEISNSRAINKSVLPSPSSPLNTMLFWSRKSADLHGATDQRTPYGIYVLLMSSVGEPINRPRHTEQRDRSQTVLAAPRDTRSRTLIKPRPGRPARGAPASASARNALSYTLGASRHPLLQTLPFRPQ